MSCKLLGVAGHIGAGARAKIYLLLVCWCGAMRCWMRCRYSLWIAADACELGTLRRGKDVGPSQQEAQARRIGGLPAEEGPGCTVGESVQSHPMTTVMRLASQKGVNADLYLAALKLSSLRVPRT